MTLPPRARLGTMFLRTPFDDVEPSVTNGDENESTSHGGARGGVTFTPKSNLNLHQGGTLFWREAITFLSRPWEFR